MKKTNGYLIVLDGVSSAGKSSIVKELQQLDKAYTVVAIDDFGTPIFIEQQEHPVSKEEFLKKLNAAEQKMFQKISRLLANKQDVILDTVLAGLQGIESIKRNFERMKTMNKTLILVYCPLGILVQRLLDRNKEAREQNKPEDERTLMHALQQFGATYKQRERDDELDLGQVSKKEILAACNEALPEFSGDENAFAQFKTDILQNLNLLEQETISITTRIPYDFVVNTAQCSPRDCALRIETYLKEKK